MSRQAVFSRYPVVVLEGPDCAGKTTLADAIVALSGARYVHMTYRFKSTARQFLNYQWAALRLCLRLSERSPVVLDRWWMSDEVYGAEFRGSPTNPGAWEALDYEGLVYGLTTVLAIPSDGEAHRARHSERARTGEEMYPTQGRLLERYGKWEKIMVEARRDDFWRYDMDSTPLERVPQLAESIYAWACDFKSDRVAEVHFDQLKPGWRV